jgi:hypothetical protein
MEADIGNPIEFNKNEIDLGRDDIRDQDQEQQDYYAPQQMMYPSMMYPSPMQQQQQKVDIFANIDKTTWIIGFVVFLLGFFMGKTMQPVILRPG